MACREGLMVNAKSLGTMGRILLEVWIGLALWSFVVVLAKAEPNRLELAEKVKMLNCEPVSTVPCFRMKINIVDAQGSHVAVPLPPRLVQSLRVSVDGQAVTPFSAVAETSGTQGHVRSRIALLLMDVSGSMNEMLATGQTRFSAAKEAIAQFLQGFENGTDRVAIVPFGSRQVLETIQSARFATTTMQAQDQIATLPTPVPSNNTALFSAVNAALDVLVEQTRNAPGSPEVILLVLTDGKNDVRPGDDANLLSGDTGMEMVARKVQTSGIQVIAVGFGDKDAVDEVALRKLSTSKYYIVQDPMALREIFRVARTLLNNRIQTTFQSPWPDRASLGGKTLHFQVSLQLSNSETLYGAESIWSAPQIGLPLFEGKCDPLEIEALTKVPPPSSPWIVVLRPVLVFIGLGGVLLILWFWVPRLVWAEQYMGNYQRVRAPRRWSGPSNESRYHAAPFNKAAPPGFEKEKKGAVPSRTPADATIFETKYESRGTRTRLEVRRPLANDNKRHPT